MYTFEVSIQIVFNIYFIGSVTDKTQKFTHDKKMISIPQLSHIAS